ncbi:MAG: type II toxin-antitoxin system HicB family antitoxin [Bacteroidia bacterium]
MKIKSNYTAIIVKASDGSYTGYIEEVPGAISQGATVKETKSNLVEALQMVLDYYKNETRKLLRNSKAKFFKRELVSL